MALKKQFEIDDFTVTVHEVRLGQIDRILDQLCTRMGRDASIKSIEDLIGKTPDDWAENLNQLIKTLPMLKTIINEMVTVVDTDGGNERSYNDLSYSDSKVVLLMLRGVNESFLSDIMPLVQKLMVQVTGLSET